MSDIFNEYAKIALDQGLVKKAQDVTKQTNPRYDSLDLEAIEMLYGVKPEGADEKHIMEQAHPDPVIIAPAYDRVNGLVENNLERQDVIHYIATKPSHGKHIMERYVKAHQDLANEVLKVAFVLDRDDEHELMALADSCAARLAEPTLKKEAIAPAVILALKVGAVALSAMGLVNNFGGMISSGFMTDIDRAIEELGDLIADDEVPGEGDTIQRLISELESLKVKYEDLNNYSISAGEDEDQIKSEIQTGSNMLADFVKNAKSVINNITIVSRLIESSGKEGGWLAKNIGDLGVALEQVGGAFWGDDKRDALVILDTVKDSISKSIGNMQKYFNAVKAKAEMIDPEAATAEEVTDVTSLPDDLAELENV